MHPKVLFKRWTDNILAQPDDTPKRFWTFIDELSEAGLLQGFPSFIKKAQSKGGRCAVATQSIEGLRDPKLYGEKVTADFLSCFGNKLCMKLNCISTADYLSNLIGDFEDYEKSYSATSSIQSDSSTTNTSLKIIKHWIDRGCIATESEKSPKQQMIDWSDHGTIEGTPKKLSGG